MFGAAFGNFDRWRLPYAAPNREVRRRSVSQRGTCRWNAEFFYMDGVGCADPAAQMVYLEEVTLHARGEAGKPPFHGLRARGKLGEGHAGAPGDQALLRRDGAIT